MTANEKNDITTKADIDTLVRHFYTRVLPDPIIGFFFTEVAKIDLEAHLPVISRFWQKQLLGTGDYHGRSFEKHLLIHQQAAITAHHFHRWLYLFKQSVNDLFSGERADVAKNRATAIADSMLKGLDNQEVRAVFEQREQSGVFFYTPPQNTK